MKNDKPLPLIQNHPDLRGKTVLLRAELNAPIEEGKVLDDFRIRKAVPTITHLCDRGARVVILSHTSRVGEEEPSSLLPVCAVLQKQFPCAWGGDILADDAKEKIAALSDGEVLLMENIRMHPEETENDRAFSKKISALGDAYVNDAFSVCHREHASIVGLPRHLPAYAGLLLAEEVEHLTRALVPEHPALFVLGGAKFDTKMPLVEKFIDTYDRVFVGGALSHDFFRARGYEIGASLSSDVDLKNSPLLDHPRLLLPIDVTVRTKSGERAVRLPTAVEKGDTILDAGPQTIDMLREQIRFAKTILWNGPLGDYEQGFSEQTITFAKAVAEADGMSIVGGGDTIASIEALNIASKFTLLSTGGGAMLVFLEYGTLPGIEALLK